MAFHAPARYWKFALVAMVLGPVLAACETAGYGAAGGSDDQSVATESSSASQGEKRVSWGLYTPLFDQGDHLNKLIGNGELVAAANLYTEQKEYFAGARDKQG